MATEECQNTSFITWSNPSDELDCVRWCPVCEKWGYSSREDNGFHSWGNPRPRPWVEAAFYGWICSSPSSSLSPFEVVALF